MLASVVLFLRGQFAFKLEAERLFQRLAHVFQFLERGTRLDLGQRLTGVGGKKAGQHIGRGDGNGTEQGASEKLLQRLADFASALRG